MRTKPFFARPMPITPYRAVHLDLKGLPPTPQRLLSLLDLFATLRFNAVVVEWEDTFPWTVDERFRCETAYTPDEIRRFLDQAAKLGIEVIPLIQCLGHMETFLREPEYAALREVPEWCDVLNPLHPESRALVERLVDDVLALMPDVKYFHLGGDEAWTFGRHAQTRAYIEQHGKGALYLHHVQPLLDRLNARGIRPMLWHDMMVQWDDASLRQLASDSDLCVWGYDQGPDETTHHYATAHIQRFRDLGITLWGGTAYKGADGHNSDLPNLPRRQENALAWAGVAQRLSFRGLMTTAWSRYNTNVQQCEPTDGALDVLALHAAILHDGDSPAGGIESCLEVLATAGERDRLERCRSTLRRLADQRRAGWQAVQDLREQIITTRDDPRRAGTDQVARKRERLSVILTDLRATAAAFSEAFRDLIPAIWIERYLSERVVPLESEHRSLD